MITDCRKLLSLVRDLGAILGLDLVCGASLAIKAPRNCDAVTVNVVFVCLVAAILEGDRDFRSPGAHESAPEVHKQMYARYRSPSLIKLFKPLPRPVTAALPPRATVIAVKTALLPPGLELSGSE